MKSQFARGSFLNSQASDAFDVPDFSSDSNSSEIEKKGKKGIKKKREVEGQERKPSGLFQALGIFSVTSGFLLGLYGFLTQDGSTSGQQYLVGAVGYLLSAVFPIILLQLSWGKHISSVSNNQNSPYDIHAGEEQQTLCRRITLFGLIVAALPIYIFFLPIAESLA